MEEQPGSGGASAAGGWGNLQGPTKACCARDRAAIHCIKNGRSLSKVAIAKFSIMNDSAAL